MKQIFILGASSVYGVGAERGGWGDLVKSYMHAKMYQPDGTGEACEVFNFSKAGSTIDFVMDTVPWIIDKYARSSDPGDLIIMLSVGGNDAKASGAPDAFVSTPEAFKLKVEELCLLLQHYSNNIIFVSNGYVDESKVNPKPQPFEGKFSYFTNERRTLFNGITKDVVQSKGYTFIAVDCDKEIWENQYLYSDGLHPNQAGYELVFNALKPILDR